MLDVASKYHNYQIIIAGAPGLREDHYKTLTDDSTVRVLFNQTYDLLRHADVALVTSGTATLETALFSVPQIVCYYVSGGKLVNFIFRRFFHVKYISLVNLIACKDVVKELFGGDFNRRSLTIELHKILKDEIYRRKMIEEYDKVIAALGKPGAAERTAELIYKLLHT